MLCDNVFTSPLPARQYESKLRSTRFEEHLNHTCASTNGTNGDCHLNGETESLETELTDPYRLFTNNEDADIWSTGNETNGEDQQQSSKKRNGLLNNRSPHRMRNGNQPDTQSILSTESHSSHQEIMPSAIRKRLSEVNSTGPIIFDVRRRK